MRDFFPAWCYECGSYIKNETKSDSRYLCLNCYRTLPFFSKAICLKCGHSHSSINCVEKWAENISEFQAIFEYKKPVHKWISSLKYSRNLVTGKILQGFVKKWFEEKHEYLQGIDLLVSVPVHRTRLRQRGFNQSSYLLNTQKVLGPDHSIIEKNRNTSHQAGMSRTRRENNLKGSFDVRGNVKGKKILLFDDVCTTGQTLAEVSACLKNSGAKCIDVLVTSRTI